MKKGAESEQLTKRLETLKSIFQKGGEYSFLNTLEKEHSSSLNENDYRKRYLDLKDKVQVIKKSKHQTTDQLFEDFKIAAEKRDSEAKKQIHKLKLEIDKLNHNNDLIKGSIKSNGSVDVDRITKGIQSKIEEEHRFETNQIKIGLQEQIETKDTTIVELQKERDEYKAQIESLQKEVGKYQLDAQTITSTTTQNQNLLLEKFEQERASWRKTLDDAVAKAEDKLQVWHAKYTKLEREKQNLESNLEQLNKTLAAKQTSIVSLSKEYEELKKEKSSTNTSNQELIDKYQEKEHEFVRYKEVSKLNIEKLQKCITDLQEKAATLSKEELTKSKNEYDALLAESEGHRVREFEEFSNVQQELLVDIEKYKNQLKELQFQNDSQAKHLSLYKLLTSITLNFISEDKCEFILQTDNEKKIVGQLSIETDDITFTPALIQNCKVTDFLESTIDFSKKEAILFILNLLENITNDTKK
ncbi:hypothetical protein CYY_001892 [Polysphondylium violaceum]|uniref:Uncharacterized protein n=1 Tax=Polysphondylium violaceum TaxID=133409 RepID=A0A8J4V183_9MYCE|nr:hypothetical protein CYY_001892 [Polysphondylium violaceum]